MRIGVSPVGNARVSAFVMPWAVRFEVVPPVFVKSVVPVPLTACVTWIFDPSVQTTCEAVPLERTGEVSAAEEIAGDVPNTAAPVPVSSVSAAARLADDGVARKVPTFEPRPEIPAIGRPVALVRVPLDGVPRAPPFTTTEPAVPTFTARAVATPVPKPEIPVESGRPVTFVRVPEAGVPSTGAVITGAVRVLFVSVSVPVRVARVPDVGKVIFVVPVVVSVKA